MCRWPLTVFLLALLATSAAANPIVWPPPGDPNPPPPIRLPPAPVAPANAVAFEIEVNDQAQVPLLIVPRSRLAVARKVAILDRPAVPLTAGVALTAAFVAAGLGLVRGDRGVRRRAASLALIGVLVAGSAAVWANAPPPLDVRRATPCPSVIPQAPPGFPLDGVKVEVTERDGPVRLVIPRSRLADIAKVLPPAPR
jgi:hypothetical protein